MEITLEQIDLIRKRANVGYKEAKEALEKSGGNVVEALAALEDEQKIKPEKQCCHGTMGKKLKQCLGKMHAISMTVTKEEKTIVNVPLTIALIATIVAPPLVIAGLILALFTNCKIRFNHKNGEECCINKNIEIVTNKVQDMTKSAE